MLSDRLWEGFSVPARRELEALIGNASTSALVVAGAARELARFDRLAENWAAAETHALLARAADPNSAEGVEHALLESDCLTALGRPSAARELLRAALEGAPDTPHLCLAMANTFADDADQSDRLKWINRPLMTAGLEPITLRAPGTPTITNISASVAKIHEGPLVSVIVPTFRARDTLAHALRSISEQSWQNFEILIVDDQSDDGTFELAAALARDDSRIRVLRLGENSGAYVARNCGLGLARGEYVTVHDADDWSHPRKLERQVRYLMAHSKLTGTLSEWARCSATLRFIPLPRLRTRWVYLNSSSLMLRREVLLELGGWDAVRVGADSELIERLSASGLQVETILPNIPLSFGLVQPTSLTQRSSTSSRTRHRGVRREYHAAHSRWHEIAARPGVPLALPQDGRPFPAPPSLLPKRSQHPDLDLLFIMDFNMKGGAFVSTMNYLHAALAAGKKVGIFHYRRYDLDVTQRVADELLDLARAGQIVRVSPGETVTARTVLVGYPVPLEYPFDLPPAVTCEHFAIITNQMSARLYTGEDVQYDPTNVSQNVVKMFGVRPTWIPISDLVRGLMVRDGRYDPIHPATWNPLIDVGAWCGGVIDWKGGVRQRPIVGRHARDHYTKWPATADALQLAYCAGRPCDVRLLGGANAALKLLERSPENWTVLPFRSIPSQEFLKELDFYVHYPHENYIEEFGRAVLEAMATGVPVILPAVFRATFGDAAVYAEPADVWPTIQSIWTDSALWLARAEAGRAFARSRSWSEFLPRLVALEGSPHKPVS